MPQAYPFQRVTATGTAVLSISQGGILHAIVLNQQSTAASTAANNFITVYDNTAANTTVNGSKIIGVIQANNAGVADYVYDCIFNIGLTLGVGSAVSPVDITITATF